MKLYYAPAACSLAVHIALREVGASFEAHAVDLATHTTADGRDYRTISPRGYVPLLELDDGSRHTEAAALLQYVADLDPHAGADRRARLAAPPGRDRVAGVRRHANCTRSSARGSGTRRRPTRRARR